MRETTKKFSLISGGYVILFPWRYPMQFSHELIVPEEGFPFKLFLFEGSEGNYRRDKHWHRSVEIFAVCGGSLRFYIDERPWDLAEDEFMIVNSNEIHSVDSPLPNETIVLQIPLKMFELYRAYMEKSCGYDMKMKSIFYNIMYYLVKEYRLTEVDQEFMRKNKNLTRLSAITSYMKDNYAGELSLEEVARVFGYSPTYLSRMFRKYAGISFKDYVQSIRLGYALKELENSAYNITEIALRNGFSGSKALARAFQKKYGMLPSEYRLLKSQKNSRKIY